MFPNSVWIFTSYSMRCHSLSNFDARGSEAADAPKLISHFTFFFAFIADR